jgi:hypothetical protein
MSHAPHQAPRRILGDDCEECVSRAGSIEKLSELDSSNIRRLGDLAAELSEERIDRREAGVSYSDERAVENLRLAARIVFASGITEEVAR